MSKSNYEELFNWLIKQDSKQPHIRQIVDLIGESVISAELLRAVERQANDALIVAGTVTREWKLSLEELNKLKEERETLAKMLGTVSILDAVKELREIARSIPDDPPGLD